MMNHSDAAPFGVAWLQDLEATRYGCGCGDPADYSFWDGTTSIHPDDIGMFKPDDLPPHLRPAGSTN